MPCPELIHARVSHIPILTVGVVLHHGDVYADLNTEDVMRCSGELRVLAHVTTKIDDRYAVEVLAKVLPHPIERNTIEEAVVGDVAYDSLAPFQEPVCRHAEGLDVGVTECVLV